MLRKGLENFARKLPAYGAPDAVLTAPETRTSSPVRIPRDGSLQSPDARGLYPCGEGGGLCRRHYERCGGRDPVRRGPLIEASAPPAD